MFKSGIIRFLERTRTFLQSKELYRSQGFILTTICCALFVLTITAVMMQNSYVITVEKNGQAQEVITEAETVQELLDEMKIEPKERDILSHSLHTPLSADMTLSWRKSVPIELELYGDSQQVWTTGATVEEMLDEQQIPLQDGDMVTPGPGLPIEENMAVEVAHYETEIVEHSVEVDYDIVKKEDPTIVEGEERVLASGSSGEMIHRFYVTYKNDEEVKRMLLDTQQEEEAEQRLIAVGTKEEPETKPQPESQPKSQTVTASVSESADSDSSSESMSSSADSSASDTKSEDNSSGSSTSSGSSSDSADSPERNSSSSDDSSSNSGGAGSTMQVRSTAYTANCSGCSGVTATGIDLGANPGKKVIAVDPSVIPLGSTVEVEGYGTAVAGDTGGNIQGKKIDVHVPNQSEAQSWGSRTVNIRIVD